MSQTTSPELLALGVDGARGGWAAACLWAESVDENARGGWTTELRLFGAVDELTALRQSDGPSATVCIDVPIGLLDTVDYRPCDRRAREILGSKRASSVFMAPARYMLDDAGDYSAIRKLVEQERVGNPAAKGLSAQAASIAPKVKEVDDWVRAHPESEQWLFECHPELSFYALAGDELPGAKSSAAGLVQRLHIVSGIFRDADERIAGAPWTARQAGLSDLLDAYAALGTAVACQRGDQDLLGGERDSENVVMRMVM